MYEIPTEKVTFRENQNEAILLLPGVLRLRGF